jgi:hypothetical protein
MKHCAWSEERLREATLYAERLDERRLRGALVRELAEAVAVLQAMVADLQEESAAYRRGVEDGRAQERPAREAAEKALRQMGAFQAGEVIRAGELLCEGLVARAFGNRADMPLPPIGVAPRDLLEGEWFIPLKRAAFNTAVPDFWPLGTSLQQPSMPFSVPPSAFGHSPPSPDQPPQGGPQP